MKDTVSVKKGRKQIKEAVRGWKEHSLAVYTLSRPWTSVGFLKNFLTNGEVIMEVEDKNPGTKKPHICKGRSLRAKLSIINFIINTKQTRRNLNKERFGKNRPTNASNC